jgi:hypothetical protein
VSWTLAFHESIPSEVDFVGSEYVIPIHVSNRKRRVWLRVRTAAHDSDYVTTIVPDPSPCDPSRWNQKIGRLVKDITASGDRDPHEAVRKVALQKQRRFASEIVQHVSQEIEVTLRDRSLTDLTTLQRWLLAQELLSSHQCLEPTLRQVFIDAASRVDRALQTLSSLTAAEELQESRRTADTAELLTQLGVMLAVPSLWFTFVQTTELFGQHVSGWEVLWTATIALLFTAGALRWLDSIRRESRGDRRREPS